MGVSNKPLSVVFDTNSVVSALVFPGGEAAWLRNHWWRREVRALVSKATVDELIRVLAYPKFGLNKEEIETLLGDYLPFTDTIQSPYLGSAIPQCHDRADQKFIDLAIAGRADILVSGDRDILDMTVTGIAIEPLAVYRKRFPA